MFSALLQGWRVFRHKVGGRIPFHTGSPPGPVCPQYGVVRWRELGQRRGGLASLRRERLCSRVTHLHLSGSVTQVLFCRPWTDEDTDSGVKWLTAPVRSGLGFFGTFSTQTGNIQVSRGKLVPFSKVRFLPKVTCLRPCYLDLYVALWCHDTQGNLMQDALSNTNIDRNRPPRQAPGTMCTRCGVHEERCGVHEEREGRLGWVRVRVRTTTEDMALLFRCLRVFPHVTNS